MISAPWSASSMVQNGPASICGRSTIRTPSRAPVVMAGSARLQSRVFAGRETRSRHWGGAPPASLLSPMAAPLDQNRALALEDVLVVLVHAVVLEAHDAGVGLLGIAGLQYLAVTIERVAVIERALQPDLVHAELHQRVLGRVLGGEPDAHRDGDAAEAQPLVIVRALGQVLVEVRFGRVHGHVGDPHLLYRLDGLAARMFQHVADMEVLEVVRLAGEGGDLHKFLPRPSSRSEMMRFWISEVPSKILVSLASRQWRSTACSVV